MFVLLHHYYMATKDNYMPVKNKQKKDHDNANLNLNQNLGISKEICCLESVKNDSRKVEKVEKVENYDLDYSKTKHNSNLWNKSNKQLPSISLNNDSEEKDEFKKAKHSNINNGSTLSLNIGIYEDLDQFMKLKEEANTFFESHNYTEAIEKYTTILRILNLSPENQALIFSNRSAAYQSINSESALTHATADAKNAIALYPNWWKGYYRMAEIAMKKSEWGLAKEYLLQAQVLQEASENLGEKLKMVNREMERLKLDTYKISPSKPSEMEITSDTPEVARRSPKKVDASSNSQTRSSSPETVLLSDSEVVPQTPEAASEPPKAPQTPKASLLEGKASKYRAFFDKGGKCKLCGESISIKKANNLKRHLERKHKKEFQELEKSVEVVAKNQKIINFPVVKNAGPLEDLVSFASTTTFSLHLVDNRHFKKFAKRIPNFKAPGKRKLRSLMFKKLKKGKYDLKKKLQGLKKKFSIIIDLGTTKSMRHSFLGVIAYYIDPTTFEPRVEAMALKLLEGGVSHTGSYIRTAVEGVLQEYGLVLDDVNFIVTDGASNMSKALKDLKESVIVEIENEAISREESEGNSNIDTDVEDNDSEKSDDPESMDEEEREDDILNTSLEDFLDNDRSYTFVMIKQLKCLPHSLMCSLKDLFKADELAKALHKRVMAIINKFHHSHKATDSLKRRAGKLLISPAATRWNSLCSTYERFLEIKTYIESICLRQNWEFLTTVEIRRMENIVAACLPLKIFTKTLEGEKAPTVSLVYHGLKHLIAALKEQENAYAKRLADKLASRFEYIIDEKHPAFDWKFKLSTLFDPQVAHLLTENEVVEMLPKLYQQFVNIGEDVQSVPIPQLQMPSPFGFGTIMVQSTDTDTSATPFNDEMLAFYKDIRRSYKSTAAEYWKASQSKFPSALKLFIHYLSVPASGNPVERLFSQMTLHSVGHKANAGPLYLEAKTLLSFNDRV
uniref:Uncharacterized protein n=1 Tax=Panagrolaimus superbus TaxID=310955 RepID=A0A914YPV0_9BILA